MAEPSKRGERGEASRLLSAAVGIGSVLLFTHAPAATITIRADVDTRNVRAGDAVTFTFSVDWIAPPTGHQWETLNLKAFQITAGSQVQSLFTACANLSALPPQIVPPPEFATGPNCASWTWVPYPPQPSAGVSGNLFRVTARFTEPGVYAAVLTSPAAYFFRGRDVLAVPLTVVPPRIVINVGTATP
jgi:hypothetical protein